MSETLQQLRTAIAQLDREIVAALAARSRFAAAAPDRTTIGAGFDEIALHVLDSYTQTLRLLCPAHAPADASASRDADTRVLETVSRRLHLARDVGRRKAAQQREHFATLIAARDAAALETSITQPDVEQEVIGRAAALAVDVRTADMPSDLPDRVAEIYRQWVIPLARREQVAILLASHPGKHGK